MNKLNIFEKALLILIGIGAAAMIIHSILN